MMNRGIESQRLFHNCSYKLLGHNISLWDKIQTPNMQTLLPSLLNPQTKIIAYLMIVVFPYLSCILLTFTNVTSVLVVIQCKIQLSLSGKEDNFLRILLRFQKYSHPFLLFSLTQKTQSIFIEVYMSMIRDIQEIEFLKCVIECGSQMNGRAGSVISAWSLGKGDMRN